jgi:hypothetical protein
MPDVRSWSTSPEAFPSETGRNAKLRAAANLAETVIGGKVGEEVRHLLWVFYNTDSATYVEELAKAIIAEAKQKAGRP